MNAFPCNTQCDYAREGREKIFLCSFQVFFKSLKTLMPQVLRVVFFISYSVRLFVYLNFKHQKSQKLNGSSSRNICFSPLTSKRIAWCHLALHHGSGSEQTRWKEALPAHRYIWKLCFVCPVYFMEQLGGAQLFVVVVKLLDAPLGKCTPLLHDLGERQEPFRTKWQKLRSSSKMALD